MTTYQSALDEYTQREILPHATLFRLAELCKYNESFASIFSSNLNAIMLTVRAHESSSEILATSFTFREAFRSLLFIFNH